MRHPASKTRWIEWLYCDHGWPDWAELEIPVDLDGYETVEAYLIERSDLHIPTWSERFLTQRVKWRDLKLTPEELRARTLKRLKATVTYYENQLARALEELVQYEK